MAPQPKKPAPGQEAIFDAAHDHSLSERGQRYESLLKVMDLQDQIQDKQDFLDSTFIPDVRESIVAEKGIRAIWAMRQKTDATIGELHMDAHKAFRHASAEDKRLQRMDDPRVARRVTRSAYNRFLNKYYPEVDYEGYMDHLLSPEEKEEAKLLAAENRQKIRIKLADLIKKSRQA
jgi:hypothetical protein